ncbi:MAG TPA: hypothetical protein EYN66_23590 [Myxococcales bacterium]|nr:hypothetical protein [Myxococcales bacterium]
MISRPAIHFRKRRMTPDGKPAPCEFPPSSPVTPNIKAHNCCSTAYDSDKNDRCDVNLTEWNDSPTWSKLFFQPAGQHYFAYEYRLSGTGANAKFTAAAYADLDCDGTFSTFERYGYGDPTSKPGNCAMKGSSAFYKNLETE